MAKGQFYDKGSEMLASLLTEIRSCTACEPELPLGANPIIQAHSDAKLLIIGQAPGLRVHQTSIAWNDPSGDRLRQWLDLDKTQFYHFCEKPRRSRRGCKQLPRSGNYSGLFCCSM